MKVLLYCASLFLAVHSFTQTLPAHEQHQSSVFAQLSIPSPFNLIQSVRTPLKDKASDIWDNFIFRISPSNVSFHNSNPTQCGSSSIPAGQILTNFSWKQNSEMQKEELHFIDCFGGLAFSEDITHDRQLTEINDLIRGGIFLSDIQNYRLKTYQGVPIFSLNTLELEAQVKYFVLIGDQPSLIITVSQEDASTKVDYQFISQKIDIAYSSYQWSSEIAYSHNSLVVQHHKNNGQTHYFKDNQEISKREFLETYSKSATPLEDFSKKIISSSLKNYFPVTAIIKSVGSDSRFLDELRIIFRKLQTATPNDIIFVRNQINLYINAITNSQLQIQDRRPKENR